MSGIVAVLRSDGSPIDRALLHRLTDALAFRGPDARATWCDEESAAVGLGHSLLRSTFEAEHEQQPATLDGQVHVTADARLDGRRDLIARLCAEGHAVASEAPDAELILRAYRAWGDACVSHLAGDFAFVLWDRSQRRLLCARDQFGVVPFYWARTRGGLVCSNTLACMREHPDVSDALNEQAIADYLVFGSNQEWDTTNFADVQRLPPGHVLSWCDGAVRVERYWRLDESVAAIRYPRAEDYVHHFNQLLDQATADRLRTDRAGVLMSGGLDSTGVAAAAKRVLVATGRPYDLRAYTWVFERLMQDQEGHFAGLAARALDIPITYLPADDALVDPSAEGANPRRSPLQLVAEYGRVMLSGLGGDPALQPDARYWLKALRSGALPRLVSDFRSHLRLRGRRPPLYLRANLNRWLGRPVWRPPYPSWVRNDLATRLGLRERLERLTDERLSDRGRTGMVSPFWSDVLANRDPDHTRVPVRVRHPFFDVRLVRYLMAIPAVPWFVEKHLLRIALTGVLPDEVRLRPKTPLPVWPHHALVVRDGVPDYMKDLATTQELGRYVDPRALWDVLHAPTSYADYEYQAAVRVLSLAAWMRRHGVARPAAA